MLSTGLSPLKKRTIDFLVGRTGFGPAQNRKLRRDTLREEPQAREYIRQVLRIADRLDPASKES